MEEGLRLFLHEGQEGLLLPARAEAFGEFKAWFGSIARELKLSRVQEEEALVACDEIFTNIASYGYPGLAETGAVKISVGFHAGRNALRFILQDTGIPFNPLEDAKETELGSALEEREIGGLGILVVKHLMDELHYRREGGANILTMTMHLDGKP